MPGIFSHKGVHVKHTEVNQFDEVTLAVSFQSSVQLAVWTRSSFLQSPLSHSCRSVFSATLTASVISSCYTEPLLQSGSPDVLLH